MNFDVKGQSVMDFFTVIMNYALVISEIFTLQVHI